MSSRPTTPVSAFRESRRRSLRSSGIFRALAQSPITHYPEDVLPLQSEEFTDRLKALADGMQTLSKHMSELSVIDNAVSTGLNEPFASFLYGLLITMFCNNFPGCPTKESYGTRDESHNASQKIASLQERLRQAKSRNNQLKAEVEKRAAAARPYRSTLTSRPSGRNQLNTPTRAAFPGYNRHKRVAVARDDTYSTNDSFMETPVVSSRALATTYGRDDSHRAQEGSGVSPNLNQPPRYMKGLFNNPTAANARRRGQMKPPVRPSSARTPARVAPRQSQASNAAQRAQQARVNRMAARPPFR